MNPLHFILYASANKASANLAYQHTMKMHRALEQLVYAKDAFPKIRYSLEFFLNFSRDFSRTVEKSASTGAGTVAQIAGLMPLSLPHRPLVTSFHDQHRLNTLPGGGKAPKSAIRLRIDCSKSRVELKSVISNYLELITLGFVSMIVVVVSKAYTWFSRLSLKSQ